MTPKIDSSIEIENSNVLPAMEATESSVSSVWLDLTRSEVRTNSPTTDTSNSDEATVQDHTSHKDSQGVAPA